MLERWLLMGMKATFTMKVLLSTIMLHWLTRKGQAIKLRIKTVHIPNPAKPKLKNGDVVKQ